MLSGSIFKQMFGGRSRRQSSADLRREQWVAGTWCVGLDERAQVLWTPRPSVLVLGRPADRRPVRDLLAVRSDLVVYEGDLDMAAVTAIVEHRPDYAIWAGPPEDPTPTRIRSCLRRLEHRPATRVLGAELSSTGQVLLWFVDQPDALDQLCLGRLVG